jgi:hypothetical protein
MSLIELTIIIFISLGILDKEKIENFFVYSIVLILIKLEKLLAMKQ